MSKNKKMYGIISIIADIMIILVELLVILKVLPFNIIGSGRLSTY